MNLNKMLSLNSEIESELKAQGVDFVHFVNISQLNRKQNKGFPNAILFGRALSRDFIRKVSNTPDYVKNMLLNQPIKKDEFHQKEVGADRLADTMAAYLTSKGYSAYSQSEDHIDSTGFYDEKTKCTPLPHKTIALMAGLGWIGKHNLLVTPEYGSAICMCSVLTDAPLTTISHPPVKPQCGNCSLCKEICSVNAIKGNTWSATGSRDDLVDVYCCTTCLECLIFCPWTQAYMKNGTSNTSWST